jgi:tRNA nucleotidyltransferase (CCA-adding enzyme)
MELNSNLKALIKLFKENGYQLYLVGGCVRDLLMNIKPNDYDLTTDARPDQMKNLETSFKIIPTGEKYGTITFLVNNETFEVTTFRNDYDYQDSRRPTIVEFSNNLEDDLKRRDFTINSIAYDIDNNSYIDPFNGFEDIKSKIIRTVGKPEERFNEDYLRIIRGYRFSYVYNFEIEENTKRVMRDMIDKINFISNERIQAELTRIFSCDNYDNLENISILLFELFPILKECSICQQNTPFHYTDVYHHSLDAIKNLKKYNLGNEGLLVCSLSLLLHDVGKVETKATDKTVDHFYNHSIVSAKYASNWLDEYCFKNSIKNQIVFLVKYHDIHLDETKDSELYKYLKEGSFNLMMLLVTIQKCDREAQNLDIAINVDTIDLQIRRIRNIYSKYIINGKITLNGKLLIEWGFAPGILYKRILIDVTNKVIDGNLENDINEIKKYVENMYTGIN